MRKAYSVLIFAFIAALVTAFYPFDNGSSTGGDDPAYQTVKKNFWDAYQNYKVEVTKNPFAVKPVDATGNFRIDEFGNFAKNENNVPVTNMVLPPVYNPDAVTGYVFTQSTGTFTTINGATGEVVLGTGNMDDNTYTNITIPFSFNFGGTNFTSFSVGSNGIFEFGSTIYCCLYSLPLNSTYDNMLSPFGWDLYSNASGRHSYVVTGSAPNRVLTIEWGNFGFYYGPDGLLNFQIKLFETTNSIQFVYGGTITAPASARTCQVGIRGVGAADVITRTSTTSWTATTAGTSISTVTFATGILPTSGLTFQWDPPAPPPTPVLVRPVYGAVGRPQFDTLQWNPSTGATAYNMQIGTDTAMGTLLFNDTTLTATSYTVGQFAPLNTYWWRVRAKNAIGWSSFTPTWKFKIMGAASTPTLVTPANNATNQPVSLTCVWRKSNDLTSKPGPIHIVTEAPQTDAVSNYWFEIYSDTTAAPVVRDSTLTDTTRAVSGLLNNTNYWWRVKAKNNVGWGTFSAYFKFTTIVAAPPAPTNVYPTNNAIGIIPTTLVDWTTSAGATQYKLQISTDSTFATTQLDSTTTVDSLLVPAGRLANNTRYYWHVRAQNVGGNSAYTPTWNFTTSLVGITQNGTEIPKVFNLYQNYPNPFNPSAKIKFDLPVNANVKMEVFNMLGQSVATLVNGNMQAGSYSVTWDAANFSSGVYFYRINAGNFTNIRKMVLIK